jgi:hypothetical protein
MPLIDAPRGPRAISPPRAGRCSRARACRARTNVRPRRAPRGPLSQTARRASLLPARCTKPHSSRQGPSPPGGVDGRVSEGRRAAAVSASRPAGAPGRRGGCRLPLARVHVPLPAPAGAFAPPVVRNLPCCRLGRPRRQRAAHPPLVCRLGLARASGFTGRLQLRGAAPGFPSVPWCLRHTISRGCLRRAGGGGAVFVSRRASDSVNSLGRGPPAPHAGAGLVSKTAHRARAARAGRAGRGARGRHVGGLRQGQEGHTCACASVGLRPGGFRARGHARVEGQGVEGLARGRGGGGWSATRQPRKVS